MDDELRELITDALEKTYANPEMSEVVATDFTRNELSAVWSGLLLLWMETLNKEESHLRDLLQFPIRAAIVSLWKQNVQRDERFLDNIQELVAFDVLSPEEIADAVAELGFNIEVTVMNEEGVTTIER